jgi:hypothetical protein
VRAAAPTISPSTIGLLAELYHYHFSDGKLEASRADGVVLSSGGIAQAA